jgi:hypothetical protein
MSPPSQSRRNKGINRYGAGNKERSVLAEYFRCGNLDSYTVCYNVDIQSHTSLQSKFAEAI